MICTGLEMPDLLYSSIRPFFFGLMADFFTFEIDSTLFETTFCDLPDVTKRATANALNKVGRLPTKRRHSS